MFLLSLQVCVEILFGTKHCTQDTENTEFLPWETSTNGRERKLNLLNWSPVCAFLC